MAIREFVLSGVGTSAASVAGVTTPASGLVWTIIGLTITNTSSGAVSFDVYKTVSSSNYYLAKGMPLPANNSHYPVGSLGKHIISPGDSISVKSSVAASLDVVLTVSEDANT